MIVYYQLIQFDPQTTLDNIENNTITDLKIKNSDIRHINEEVFSRITTLLTNNTIIKALTPNKTITDVAIKYLVSISDHTSAALENLLKQNHTITKFELSYSRLHHIGTLSLFIGLY